MSVFTVIGFIVALIILIFKAIVDKEAIKLKKQQEAENEIKQGIKEGDPSSITGGFDNLNR